MSMPWATQAMKFWIFFPSGKRRQGFLKGLVGRNPGDDSTIARVPSLTAGEFPHFATVSDSGVF